MVRMTHLRHLRPTHRLLALGLGAWALASCAQPPAQTAAQPPAQLPAEKQSQRLARELRTAIGPAACSADSQCRTLPVGAKACGGPAGYLAWSTSTGDLTRLAEMAARQAQAERKEQEASGMQSNCAVVTDPGAVCKAGHCQLNSTAANAAQ